MSTLHCTVPSPLKEAPHISGVFQVTGQLQHMVPALVAVLLAVIVGNAFTRGLYDTLIIMKVLPLFRISHTQKVEHTLFLFHQYRAQENTQSFILLSG